MGGSRFELRLANNDDRQVLVLSGDLDAHSAAELEAALREVPAGSSRIVLDMQHVDFIDSAGLGVIVAENRERGDGVVVLSKLNDRVAKVLEYAGLVGHLTIE
jgi:anti-sigma B factor antagonist